MTSPKRRLDMAVGFLYIVQYPMTPYFKAGRSIDAKLRLQQYPRGTVLHFTILTSDMRRAESAMARLRTAGRQRHAATAQGRC